MDKININETIVGKVVKIIPQGYLVEIEVSEDEIISGLFKLAKYSSTPIIGSEVFVHIKGKNEDRVQIFGEILKVNG